MTIAANDDVDTMWNRAADSNLDVVGDRRVLDVWRASCNVIWGR